MVKVSNIVSFLTATLAFESNAQVADTSANLAENQGLTSRIIGGTDANAANYSYIAHIRNNDIDLTCTGSLIAPAVVITAAHCVKNFVGSSSGSGKNLSISLGSIEPPPSGGKTFTASKVVVNPDYNSDTHENDLALILLSECASKSLAVPIDIETKPLSDPNDIYFVAGFGRISVSNNELASTLQELPVIPGSTAVCNAAFSSIINPKTNFCVAQTLDKTTCFGDSGGPIVYSDYSKLLGVESTLAYSNGNFCATKNSAALYMLLSGYWESFISKHVYCTGPSCDYANVCD
ncbi:Serine protease ami, partial [Zancudomyces culisetae]